MKVLIDNGHGENTPGKCSPDKRLMEWAYTREIADRVVAGLRQHDIEARRLVKEKTDIPLAVRCRRANDIYRETERNAILVSIHCNAAGNGESWKNARGWSVFVSDSASANSRRLATCLGETAESWKVPVRKQMPGQMYWTQNLAICRDTNCPAVLTENLFQDNPDDVAFLLSDEGKETLARIHVDGVLAYLKGGRV